MKNIFKIIGLVAVLNLTTGCASFLNEISKPGQTVQAYLPYIKPSVAFITTAVLNYAVSEKDRVDKALTLYYIAGVVQTLSKGETLTPEQLEEALSTVTPKKQHWAQFVVGISSVYSSVYYRVSGDAKISLDTLAAIADGIRSGVLPFVSDVLVQE